MSNYFQNIRSSELSEIQEQLNSMKPEEKKDAVKTVIAMMTIGKDVSSLFPHVVKCMETTSIELKKLVYLYIINYARVKPDLTIIAINTFRKDAHEKLNPLIRALAVRTMSCIRVEKITEYLCESLKDCLIDDDPYVKKTAAISVAKLYAISPRLVREHGFPRLTQNLLNDGNALVVSNAAAALLEISRASGKDYLKITPELMGKLLNAVNETNEWGQVFILEAIHTYEAEESKEVEDIIERVLPRLSHQNPAVVLAAVKVILRNMEFVLNADTIRTLTKKLAAPLVSLLSSQPEIQYVALRNINFILQKRGTIFDKNIKMFFCKYNDPIFVKLEKVDVLTRVADNQNVDVVMSEMKEYASDIDMDLVRKAVRSIGTIACRVERISKRAVEIVLEILKQQGAEQAVQEAVVIAKDILRRYPKRYDQIISAVMSARDRFYEPEAKASFVWIAGEYAEDIENAEEQIEHFVQNFSDENARVQLQILTAAVKLYLKKTETEDLVTKVLNLSTGESDNPDLRDRGYIYWRMLSTDPNATKLSVLSDKPAAAEENDEVVKPDFLDTMLENISSLASVYYVEPSSLFGKKKEKAKKEEKKPEGKEEEEEAEEEEEEEEKDEPAPPKKSSVAAAAKKRKEETAAEKEKPKKEKKQAQKSLKQGEEIVDTANQGPDLNDLLGLSDMPLPAQTVTSTPTPQLPTANILDELTAGIPAATGLPTAAVSQVPPAWAQSDALFGGTPQQPARQRSFTKQPFAQVLSGNTGGINGITGLQIEARFQRIGSDVILDLRFNNTGLSILSDFAIQFNKNSFGLAAGVLTMGAVMAGGMHETSVRCSIDNNYLDQTTPPSCPFKIQVAVKCSADVYYFDVSCLLHVLLNSGSDKLTKDQFRQYWTESPKQSEVSFGVEGVSFAANTQSIQEVMEDNSLFFLAQSRREESGQDMLYFGAKTINNLPLLFEVAHPAGGRPDSVQVTMRIPVPPLIPLTKEMLQFIFKAA